MTASAVSVDRATRRVKVEHYEHPIPLPEWHPLVQSWCEYRLNAGLHPQLVSVYCARAHEFLNWCKTEFRIGPAEITTSHAFHYLRHVERKPINYERLKGHKPVNKTGKRISMSTLRNYSKTINGFGRWLQQSGINTRFRPVSWSDYTGGAKQHPPVPMVRFDRAPELPEQITADTSIDDLLARYQADAVLNRMSPVSALKYAETLRVFLPWCQRFRDHAPAQLTRDDVHAYVMHMAAAPKPGGGLRSPNTVKRYFGQIKNFARWAKSVRLLDVDITEGWRGPRGRTVLIPPPTTETVVHAIRASFEGRTAVLKWRNYTILMFLAYTGIRRAALGALTRDQVQGQSEVIVTGKGEKQRVIGIAPALKDAIDRYLELRTDMSAAFLVDQDGNPLAAAGAAAVVKAVSKRIGKSITPHAFRRFHFTKLANEGADIVALKAAGGWSSLPAAEHYIHSAGDRAGVEMQQRFTLEGVELAQ